MNYSRVIITVSGERFETPICFLMPDPAEDGPPDSLGVVMDFTEKDRNGDRVGNPATPAVVGATIDALAVAVAVGLTQVGIEHTANNINDHSVQNSLRPAEFSATVASVTALPLVSSIENEEEQKRMAV